MASQQEQIKALMLGLGTMAEMAHAFHGFMVKAGATKQEADVALTAYIQAFWHESMQDARASRAKQQEDTDENQLDP